MIGSTHPSSSSGKQWMNWEWIPTTSPPAPRSPSPPYDKVVRALEERLGRPIGTGRFGADMQVSLTNDGPVTIWIDSKARE